VSGGCQVPGRWALDALARDVVLAAAERELVMARQALEVTPRSWTTWGHALDRYLLALTERNAVRDGRP
jgi:hypothetical protein